MTTWDGLSGDEKQAMRAFGITDMDSAENRQALEIYRAGYIDGLQDAASEMGRAIAKTVHDLIGGDVIPRRKLRLATAAPLPPRGKMKGIAAALRMELDQMASGAYIGSEAQIAKDFGVSRQTAREACLLLQRAGLLEVRHGLGRYKP